MWDRDTAGRQEQKKPWSCVEMQEVQVDWRKHEDLQHSGTVLFHFTDSFQLDCLHRNRVRELQEEIQAPAVKVQHLQTKMRASCKYSKLQWGNEVSFPDDPIKKKRVSFEERVPILKFYPLIKSTKGFILLSVVSKLMQLTFQIYVWDMTWMLSQSRHLNAITVKSFMFPFSFTFDTE